MNSGNAMMDACRDGVGSASDSKPSSPTCLEMCDKSYGAKGKGALAACKKGCAMFPEACLRDGKIAPKDNSYDRQRGDRKWKPTPQRMPKQPRYRDPYRHW